MSERWGKSMEATDDKACSRIEIAHHEAGHYVAAYVLREWDHLGPMSTLPGDDPLRTQFRPADHLDHSRARQEALIVLAGLMARQLAPGASPMDVDWSKSSGSRKVDDLCAAWGLDYRAIESRAANLIATHWEAVNLLAIALADHGTLSSGVAKVILSLTKQQFTVGETMAALQDEGLFADSASSDTTRPSAPAPPRWLLEHARPRSRQRTS